MILNPTRVLLPLAAFAVLALGSIGPARAQSRPVAPAASDPDKTNDPALKGPPVGDRPTAKGKPSSGFGPDAIEKKKQGGKKPAPPMAMADFVKSLNVLRTAPTPESNRLTADQDAKIKIIASDFESSVKQYMDKNKAELDTLRARLSPNDRNMLDQQLQRGGPIKLSKAGFGAKGAVLKQRTKNKDQTPADSPAAGAGGFTQSKDDAAKTRRARLVEIYAGRPKPEDAQARIMGVLTSDQLSIVNDELAKHDAMAGPHNGHARGHKPVGR